MLQEIVKSFEHSTQRMKYDYNSPRVSKLAHQSGTSSGVWGCGLAGRKHTLLGTSTCSIAILKVPLIKIKP